MEVAPTSTVTVNEIWRYPVKSMGGEQINAAAVGDRGLHADRMWAVRDPALGAISTARRLPALLACTARYARDPSDMRAEPGHAPEVIITLPDGEEISSADRKVHVQLSELVGREVRLEPLPALTQKERHRAPRETKADLRAKFGLAEDEPMPDLSLFPLRKLAELARYVTPVGSYVDAYPLHLITHASLTTMAEKAPQADFDVKRFRPNLLIETGADGELPENAWCGTAIEGSEVILRGEIPTIRCVMPTREQRGLEADADVLRTVAAHAERCLGIYATVERAGEIAVGEELRVRPSDRPSRRASMTRGATSTLKRGMLRAAGALMP